MLILSKWVYLLCKDLTGAKKLCEGWLDKEEVIRGGAVREMNYDRNVIDILGLDMQISSNDLANMPAQHRLQVEFVLGLVALAESNSDEALVRFEKAMAACDDWEVHRYANALYRRIKLDRRTIESWLSRRMGLLRSDPARHDAAFAAPPRSIGRVW